MSLFGEAILERLPDSSGLWNPVNPIRRIINNGLGEWLDRFDDVDVNSQVFLSDATGGFLDLWGKDFGVPRRLGEDDEVYRQRIILESLGYLNVPYLIGVYGLVLYCFVEDFDPSENTLTSDNPYVCSRHMTFADEDIQGILRRKFVLGSDLNFIGGE